MERRVIEILVRCKLTIAVAESCTGGFISHSLTNVPGSSAVFLGGIVAYSNSVKTGLCGVSTKTIATHGAVSQETALELARGVRRRLKAKIGLGVTGVAGPGGGSTLKPVGTVFIAIATGRRLFFKKYAFKGSRLEIKEKTKKAALKLLLECLA